MIRVNQRLISKLSKILDKRWNQDFDHPKSKELIKNILNGCSNQDILNAFDHYIRQNRTIHRQETPIYTLIIVLSLLIRNLDCANELADHIKDFNLTSRLYGGLSIFLKGQAQNFSLKIKWTDDSFKNKFQFLNRFEGEFGYWKYIEIFEACRILVLIDEKQFDKLILEDSSKFIILNMFDTNPEIVPSNELIEHFLQSTDDFEQNIGFYNLTRTLRNMLHRSTRLTGTSKVQNDQRVYKESLLVLDRLNNLSNEYMVSLLINFILSESIVPVMFIQELTDPVLQDYLIAEIKSDKVRNLNDLYKIVCILKLWRRHRGSHKANVQKIFAMKVLVFYEKRTGIYQWTDEVKGQLTYIIQFIPTRYRSWMRSSLLKSKRKLMSTHFDSFVRFNIFLKDKAKSDIAEGMLSILE